jgi:hypothetical protein
MSTSPRPGSVSGLLKSIKHRITGSSNKSEDSRDMSSEASGVVDLGAADPSDDKPVKVEPFSRRLYAHCSPLICLQE